MLLKRKSGLLVLLAAALAASPSAPVAAGPEHLSITWSTSCDQVSADCGTLSLPVDWTHPSAARFDLSLVRVKAADQSRRIGVLMVNPGGPGDSGVDFALRASTYFSPEVLARFDIVGFDPRGVKRTSPITCSKDLLAARPSTFPANQVEFDRVAAYNQQLRADCRSLSGPVFDHADTLSVVQDVDALRRALGERRITYFGHSYGSLIGEQYAERYGDHLRAMVISATMDHSLGTEDFLVSEAITAEDSFTQFTTWCSGTPSCALHDHDTTSTWNDLLARADRGEVSEPTAKILANTVKLLKNPQWTELAAYLRDLTEQPPTPTVPTDPPNIGVLQAVFCQDWQIRPADQAELARLTALERQAAPHMHRATAHDPAVGCIGLPPATNPQHHLHITKAPPILILNSAHDPVTPYSWPTNVHQQSADTTVLLTYDGWGHQVYNRNTCTRTTTDTYLLTLTTPTPALHCPAVPPPA
ncbi:alpha/beta fold hydrolase [Umezawaea sp. Da 62-37]|uniref:alpha/beta fold hydrolase n=1 Tax=Umezawaea sp. Da 62-37 TaxID=3075927 RepID=UPI0028F737BF|nr:alpha/beta fold hydrolase [Umezawaea sp. Da 62-37]WNV90394.1 alpha/beta fold hydrolase [Umezawaea sp. Da 62-37]